MMRIPLILLATFLMGTGFFGVLKSGQTIAHSADLTIKEDQMAPDFTLLNQHGNSVRLSEQRGQWVVLYFYPKDDTPGCTKEACSFRDNIIAIQQLNAVVLGVSVDSVVSHKTFSDKYNLNFPILADDQYKVCNQYGTLTDYMGRKMARRSTVIIDPEGVIRKIFPSVEPADHALEIHRALKELQGL